VGRNWEEVTANPIWDTLSTENKITVAERWLKNDVIGDPRYREIKPSNRSILLKRARNKIEPSLDLEINIDPVEGFIFPFKPGEIRFPIAEISEEEAMKIELGVRQALSGPKGERVEITGDLTPVEEPLVLREATTGELVDNFLNERLRPIKKIIGRILPESKRGAVELAKAVPGVNALFRSTLEVAQNLGFAGQAVSKIVDSSSLETLSTKTVEFLDKKIDKFPRAEVLKQSVRENPSILLDPEFVALSFLEAVPSFATMLIPATGTVKGVNILGKAFNLSKPLITKLAALGSVIVGGTVGGSLEGGSTFNEVKELGGTDEQAVAAFELMTALSGVLNSVGLLGILGKGAVGPKKVLFGALGEAITEYLEIPTEAGILRIADLIDNNEVFSRLIEGTRVLMPAGLLGGAGTVISGDIFSPELSKELEKQGLVEKVEGGDFAVTQKFVDELKELSKESDALAKEIITPETIIEVEGEVPGTEVEASVENIESQVSSNKISISRIDVVQPDATKPQGAFFSIEFPGFESSQQEAGDKTFKTEVQPKNPLVIENIEEESAGIAGLKQIVGEAEFNRLKELGNISGTGLAPLRRGDAEGKIALVDELSERFPDVEWNRFFDSQEILEGLAGVIAREQGHDAIIGIARDLPEFSEVVILDQNLLKDIRQEAQRAETQAEEVKAEEVKIEARPKEAPENQKILEPTLTPEEQSLPKNTKKIFTAPISEVTQTDNITKKSIDVQTNEVMFHEGERISAINEQMLDEALKKYGPPSKDVEPPPTSPEKGTVDLKALFEITRIPNMIKEGILGVGDTAVKSIVKGAGQALKQGIVSIPGIQRTKPAVDATVSAFKSLVDPIVTGHEIVVQTAENKSNLKVAQMEAKQAIRDLSIDSQGNPMTETQQEDLTLWMTGETSKNEAENSVGVSAVASAQRYKDIIQNNQKELNDRGLISDETYFEFAEGFLPRIYSEKEYGSSLKIADRIIGSKKIPKIRFRRDKFVVRFFKGGRESIRKFETNEDAQAFAQPLIDKKRKVEILPPITKEQRELLGEIRDPAILTARILMFQEAMIANFDFLKGVASNSRFSDPGTTDSQGNLVPPESQLFSRNPIPNSPLYGPLRNMFVKRSIRGEIVVQLSDLL